MWASRGKLKQNLARLKIALYIAGEQFRSRRKTLLAIQAQSFGF